MTDGDNGPTIGDMVTASERMAARKTVCDRNVLRREARLPLLDVQSEIEKELHRSQVSAYAAAVTAHYRVYNQLRDQVIRDFRVSRGSDFPTSVGGGWLIDYEARRRFAVFLRTLGIDTPSGGIRYGSAKTPRIDLPPC